MLEYRKKNNTFRNMILFVFISILIFSIAQSSFFELKEIQITGNQKLSEERIKEIMQIHEGINMFAFSIKSTKDKLLKDPNVEKVTIKRRFPNQLMIRIQEKSVIAYIVYLDTYLYLNENGQVMSSNKVISEPRIFVEGTGINQFALGERLPITEEVLNTIVTVSNLIVKYDIKEARIVLDVKDPLNLQMKIGKIIVNLGDLKEIDYKIRNVKEAIKTLSQGYEGYYDITNTQNPLFKPLT